MGTNMSLDKIILKAEDLDGYLTRQDKQDLEKLENMYNETMAHMSISSSLKIKKKSFPALTKWDM